MKTIEKIRNDFPILSRDVNGKKLVYLDNGASSQKPKSVIDCIDQYYSEYNSNIHRGVHHLSQVATSAYEEARKKVQNFINAKFDHEVIFTKGTTDSINLLAFSLGETMISEGSEIIISEMEHHSNIVPWQMLCERKGLLLKVCRVSEKGELDLSHFKSLVNKNTAIVSVVHISNTLGTINPIEEIITISHTFDAKVIVDAAQSVPHMPLDVQKMNCDFLVFSGHKMFGPTGKGVLFGKEQLLNQMTPYQGGGDMIKDVSFEKTTYNCLPHKFEAGTPNIVGGIALGRAIDYINEIGYDFIQKQEKELLEYATKELKKIEGIRFIGEAENKASVISFLLNGTHPFDLGTILDQLGVAIRTGHHCTQPLMTKFNIPGTARASFAFYNNKEDVDIFIAAVKKARTMLC